MKVTVFGIGYVGLVQAAILASVGHDVLCVDVDATKVENDDVYDIASITKIAASTLLAMHLQAQDNFSLNKKCISK